MRSMRSTACACALRYAIARSAGTVVSVSCRAPDGRVATIDRRRMWHSMLALERGAPFNSRLPFLLLSLRGEQGGVAAHCVDDFGVRCESIEHGTDDGRTLRRLNRSSWRSRPYEDPDTSAQSGPTVRHFVPLLLHYVSRVPPHDFGDRSHRLRHATRQWFGHYCGCVGGGSTLQD